MQTNGILFCEMPKESSTAGVSQYLEFLAQKLRMLGADQGEIGIFLSNPEKVRFLGKVALPFVG